MESPYEKGYERDFFVIVMRIRARNFFYCNAKNFLMQAEQFNSRGDDNVS